MMSHEELAKRARKYMLENLERHVTIEELASYLGVSPTHVKNIFREVYDMSVYAFFRREKMLVAAEELKSTEDTVLEIAGRHGYENGSKFACAFRKVMGMSPRSYRNKIRYDHLE